MANHDDSLDIAVVLEDFYQNYQANGYSERTMVIYKNSLGIWQKFLSERGITSLTEITRETMLDYRYYLMAVHRSPQGNPITLASQGQKIAALKAFFNYCVTICKILVNPADCLKFPKLKKNLPRGVLSKQQMKKLLNLPDLTSLLGFRDRAILEVFYATGVRKKELLGIKVSHCYLTERRLFIAEGKGNKSRWVPLPGKTAAILRSYLERIRPALLKDKNHDTLFVSRLGDPLSASAALSLVKSYLNLLGIKSDCHGLRHTCATHLLQGKANIRVIQEVLGHSSLSSTQIYTQVDLADLTRAIERSHPRSKMDCKDLQ